MPLYQRLATRAADLQQLGLSMGHIARRLGVDYKTAAKAIALLGQLNGPSE